MRKIKELAEYLENDDIKLYYCGGYVRDIFFNQNPKDIDMVAFGCTFDYLRKACDIVGIEAKVGNEQNYPILVCTVDNIQIEITIPRSLEDSNSVKPNPYATIEQDALRRDFTCNALYKNVLTDEIEDPLGGLEDIDRGNLRVCNVNTFVEDNRRVLRAAEAISRFGLNPNRELIILSQNTNLSGISNEVIGKCIKKILMGRDINSAFNFLVTTNAIKLFDYLKDTVGFDQKNIHHEENLFEHLTLAAELGAEHCLETALAGLYHDIGKLYTQELKSSGQASYIGHEDKSVELVGPLLISYGFGNETTRKVCEIIQNHMLLCTQVDSVTAKGVRKLHGKLKYITLDELFQFGIIDQMARRPEGNLEVIKKFKEIANESPETKSEFQPIIMGRHLIEIFQMDAGIEMGNLLAEAKQAQINGDFTDLSSGLGWIGKKLDIQPKRIRVDLPITKYDIAAFCDRHGFDMTAKNIEIIAQKIRDEVISLMEGWGDD